MADDVIERLRSVGAILTNDHLVYTSGKHGSVYVNKDAMYPHVRETSDVCAEFAHRAAEFDIEAVVGPALGGIILAQWTAYHLSRLLGRDVLALYAEKADDTLVLRRGYDRLVHGKRVFVVEDIINTGGSALKAVEAVRGAGGIVAAVGVLVNRSPDTVTSDTFGAPLIALAEFPAEAYAATDCPLCKEGRSINTSVGHGKKFLESRVSL